MVKNPVKSRRLRFDPWVQKIPWRREWQSTPVFLPGEFHGQRGLVGYNPWGCKESDTTEQLNSFIPDGLMNQIGQKYGRTPCW